MIAAATVFGFGHEDPSDLVDLSSRISESELARIRLTSQGRDDLDTRWLRFGFDPRASPEEDARQYLPFLAYLERVTGYRFELNMTQDGEELFRQLGEGVVDVAAVGAVSYIKARQEYGAVPLVRGLNRDGKATYRSLIIAAGDSRLASVADLRGRRLALGNVDSTQGHIIPRISLLEHGITLEDLARYEFTGSHRNCAKALLSGRFEACAIQDTMGHALAATHQVKVLFESKAYPSSGIAANPKLPPDVLDGLRQALLDFDPKGRERGMLYKWDRTEMPNGFTTARDGDYRELREAMRRLAMLD